MHRALYRKWRSVDFDDVCGQGHVTDILKYQVDNDKVSHAYLFCGSRGTGKTSCAKILAKAVNCLAPRGGNPCNECESCKSIHQGLATDVIEMDAASNNSVDNVRDLTEEIIFAPAYLKYRVYIIDEVHMMSSSAFNALLKTLEEPPAHAIFILATTELHKLPSTIVSRCQRFDFRRLSSNVIVDRLMKISAAENIDLDNDGARLIARLANGGMRDAVSLLELCAGSNSTVDEDIVSSMLGGGNRKEIQSLVIAIAKRDYSTIYSVVRDAVMSSRDISVIWSDLIAYYRDMMIQKNCGNTADYLDLTDIESQELKTTAGLFSMEQLVYHTKIMEDALYNMQRPGFSARSTAEIALTRMCDTRLSDTPEALLSRISELENRISLGIISETIPKENCTKNEKNNKADNKRDTTKEKNIIDISDIVQSKAKDHAPDTYRSLSYWRDIAEKIASSKRSLSGILRDTKAYKSGNGAFLIRTSGSFAADMINREDNLALIKSAISSEEGHDIRNSPFAVEYGDISKDKTFVDELEEALNS